MKVFITGITGTLGTALAKFHLEMGDHVSGISRNEERCIEWPYTYCCKVFIGDAATIGDSRTAAHSAAARANRIYHCAAMKHVDQCERDPVEAVRQNVALTSAVVALGVPVILASTDKAYQPLGVYGATKLTAERIVLNAGGRVVRFGNLIGSSGSVFRLWRDADEIKLTDPNMTRYFIPVNEAARFMASSLDKLSWPSMRAVRMGDVAEALGKPIKIVGMRPGEVLHQRLSETESSETAPRWDVKELLKEAGIHVA